jgi:DNA-directed RNA polymerase specialized sigma24 family protein
MGGRPGAARSEDSARSNSTAPTVEALVDDARVGDQKAWNALVSRYSPLVWAICRRFNLSRLDSDDVGQSVWLLLIEHLPALRQPAALPGWIATTTRRECMRVLRQASLHRETPGS